MFSCSWVTKSGAVTKKTQYITSTYGNTWLENIDWPKDAISYSQRVTLPSSAKGKWSVDAMFRSGPQNVDATVNYAFPGRSFTTSSCQTKSSCEIMQTVPKNVSPSATFKHSNHKYTYLMSDPALISEFKKNNFTVTMAKAFKIKLDTTFTTAAGNTPATPAISENIVFGPTLYVGDTVSNAEYFKTRYTVITNRVYNIINVTEANWNVNVGKSFAPNGKKTQITSFLMTDKDYGSVIAPDIGSCPDKCDTPSKLAIKGTLCVGLSCSKSIKSLNPAEKYRLFVSYPKIINAFAIKLTSASSSPMKSIYNQQYVKTQVFVKGWKLAA
jgi:hypothetical protein